MRLRRHKQICNKIHRGGNAEQYYADKTNKEAVAWEISRQKGRQEWWEFQRTFYFQWKKKRWKRFAAGSSEQGEWPERWRTKEIKNSFGK